MQHRIAHSLELDLARRAVRKAADNYVERFAKYTPVIRWDNEDRARLSFSAKGVTLEGTLQLEPRAIVLEVTVPFLLKPFAGKAVAVIEREVQHWIGVAARGEL